MVTIDWKREAECPCCSEPMTIYAAHLTDSSVEATLMAALSGHAAERRIWVAVVPFGDDETPEYWVSVVVYIDHDADSLRFSVTDTTESLWKYYGVLVELRGLSRSDVEANGEIDSMLQLAEALIFESPDFANFLLSV
jgi:hypothetical protein